ncbi:MAG: hypothetical protein HC875_38655 [Anaerolineales bacterium]|nr:hypothetical protein [Anaerolineales bacterium]
MNRLTRRFILLAGLVALTCLGVTVWPTKSYNIYSSLADKHQRLAAVESPKIVFIGGSSLALGLDSETVQSRIRRPVVNMGLNGGFGLRYILDEVISSIGPGDVIAISPEYEHWTGTLLDGGLNMLWAIRANPRSIFSLTSPNQYVVLIRNLPEFNQGKFMEILPGRYDPIYNRDAFNDYGDFVNHLNQPKSLHLGGVERINTQAENPETAKVLQDFALLAESRGATVVYSFPPLAETQFKFSDNQTAIAHIVEQLKTIPQITLIDHPADHIYPDTMFFDTVYHLNAEGRKLRSTKVATGLLKIVQRTTHTN